MENNFIPRTQDAFRLLMNGEETLSRISYNGMKIDIDYMRGQKDVIIKECTNLRTDIFNNTEIGRMWWNRFDVKSNLDSTEQLTKVIYDDFKFDKVKLTEKGNKSTDKTVIEKLPYEFSSLMLKRNQLKVLWQNLISKTIQECDENGFVHPNFKLESVRTYRSSCDAPNLQNQPKHNEMQKKIVRTGFIPRTSDRMLVEIDLRANEVACGCSIHHDPKMMEFLELGEKADMHKTLALHYYKLPDADINKKIRNSVKGRFVFASSYGATHESIGRNLWEWVTEENPKTETGVHIKDHMATFGVKTFDDMIKHTEQEYDWFWYDLFSAYGNWKEDCWNKYKRDGYLDYPTGFRVVAKMAKTQAINTIIQGSAFHVLLATLIELERRMRKYGLKSCIIGQIHDSILLDVVPSELQLVYNLYLDSQAAVRKRWSWLCFPIVAEADVGEVGGSWAKMHETGPIHKIEM